MLAFHVTGWSKIRENLSSPFQGLTTQDSVMDSTVRKLQISQLLNGCCSQEKLKFVGLQKIILHRFPTFNCSMILHYHSLQVSIGRRSEGDCLVKRLFLKNVMHNINLLHTLGKGSPTILFPCDYIRRNFPELHNGLFSCLACGVLCFACAAITKPTEVGKHNLLSADCGNIRGSGFVSDITASNWGLVPQDMLTVLCWIPA
ncbi:uncharacterized protein LOC108194497 isoform X2 [Daucus carota subsp. sativus]|uniref:uncharacterized protein LOC108194497 isoform X2 n=1 Tax=Daucus carota subsp. sativus TaxID=79200 RepID=UPI0007EF272E|nr:PREDICTED: uncharacterized protein LOC108194497 isoform X2 [Daucus carota subsp. sativus]